MAKPTAEQTPEGWDRSAPAYEASLEPFTRKFAAQAWQAAAVSAQSRVLEVACGSGALALMAARAGATVVATDFSPLMVERLRTRVQRLDLENVEALVMDGQALKLADDSFDAAFCLFGLMFFPNPGKGLSEMARVLAPDGVAVVTTWAGAKAMETYTVFNQAVQQAVPDYVPPATPAVLSLSDAGHLKELAHQAGLARVSLATVQGTFDAASPEDAWQRVSSASPMYLAFRDRVGPHAVEEVRKAYVRLLRDRFGSGPVALQNSAHLLVARKA